jgi:hypothetical protein
VAAGEDEQLIRFFGTDRAVGGVHLLVLGVWEFLDLYIIEMEMEL